MPGRQITDHQMELYMTYRKTDRRALAAAKAGFSRATADPLCQQGRDTNGEKA